MAGGVRRSRGYFVDNFAIASPVLAMVMIGLACNGETT